jgi:hypothetical protein
MDEQTAALYKAQLERAWEDIQSSTDSSDKSMLTLSSGALGVSLAFIKDIVPLGQASWVWLLQTSWVAFALCITITVLSFQVSIAALKQHVGFLDKVNVEGKEEFFNKKTYHWTLLKWCTWGAIAFFLAGLLCTMLFVVENVSSFHAADKARIPESATITNVRSFRMTEEGSCGKPIEKAVHEDHLKKGREPIPMVQKPATPVCPPAAPPSNAPAKAEEK